MAELTQSGMYEGFSIPSAATPTDTLSLLLARRPQLAVSVIAVPVPVTLT